MTTTPIQSEPILLFDGQCGVCRRIAGWVQTEATRSGEARLIVRPIGDDPQELRALNRDLDIWEAYATIHVLMPDGSLKRGGEAVAEVLRKLPRTSWFARSFALAIFGFRPFQTVLNMAYVVLADVRPLFGCESCGKAPWIRAIRWLVKLPKLAFGARHQPRSASHFTAMPRAAQPK